MNIVMVAGEARPFVKTGGLADVTYSLSKELVLKGQTVSIIIPFYKQIREKINPEVSFVTEIPVQMSWRVNVAKIYKTVTDGVTYYLIASEQYFERNAIYGEGDDMERFAFFTMATKLFLNSLEETPDIIHIHDWHPGMLPCLLREDNQIKEKFKYTKCVLTIHNPAFQGCMDKYFLGNFYNLSDDVFFNGKVRFKDGISTLKAGIEYVDKITTVSPTHHEELLTPEGGMGLDSVLKIREYDFSGILNGIDYREFDPAHDPLLIAPYNALTFFRNKIEIKRELFKELGIIDYGQPCFSLVSRVTWQKGMDLVFAACEALASKGANIILLGSGEGRYESAMENLHRRYPKNVAVYIGYNDALAHKVYASTDFFLMPSLFEPCGLGQMIAQRYGALPVVRRTGGLKDSVINYDGTNIETANGFGFDSFSCDEMVRTCLWAFDLWHDLSIRKKLMKNALKTDNTWLKSANQYLDIYKVLTNK